MLAFKWVTLYGVRLLTTQYRGETFALLNYIKMRNALRNRTISGKLSEFLGTQIVFYIELCKRCVVFCMYVCTYTYICLLAIVFLVLNPNLFIL